MCGPQTNSLRRSWRASVPGVLAHPRACLHGPGASLGSRYVESGRVGQAWLHVRAHLLFPFQKPQMGKKNKVGAGEKYAGSEGSPHFSLTQTCARKFWSEHACSSRKESVHFTGWVREFTRPTMTVYEILHEWYKVVWI